MGLNLYQSQHTDLVQLYVSESKHGIQFEIWDGTHDACANLSIEDTRDLIDTLQRYVEATEGTE